MIGPTVHIPRTELVCTRCDYYKEHLLRSGRNPEWRGECLHPNRGMHGRYYPMTDTQITPEWCPELPANKASLLKMFNALGEKGEQ